MYTLVVDLGIKINISTYNGIVEYHLTIVAYKTFLLIHPLSIFCAIVVV